MIPDNFLTLFFTNVQYQKLIFFYELYQREIHYFEIENKLDESKRKVKRIVDSLKLDIDEYSYEYNLNLQLYSTKEKFYFSRSVSDEEYIHLKNYLQEKYLQTSGIYKSVLFVLERRRFSLLKLTNYLSYSESYVYKLLKKMNEFFENIHLGISISKDVDSKYVLVGEEKKIRMLHYFLLNIALAENDWRFQTIQEHQIELIHNSIKSDRINVLSPSNLKRVSILVAIHELAIKNGNRLPLLHSDLKDVGRIMNKEKEMALYLDNQYKRKLGETFFLRNEIIQLSFILNYFSPELRTQKEKISIGKELLHNKSNKIILCCVNLIREIQIKYSIRKDLQCLLLYSLCNQVVVIHYLGLHEFLELQKSVKQRNKLEREIERLVNKCFKEYRDEPPFLSLSESIIQLVSSYTLLCNNSTLNVYIEFQHRPEYKVIVENAIRQNYNYKTLNVVEDYIKADIVVADTYINNYKKDFFYFRNVFDKESWIKLTQVIDTYLKK